MCSPWGDIGITWRDYIFRKCSMIVVHPRAPVTLIMGSMFYIPYSYIAQ